MPVFKSGCEAGVQIQTNSTGPEAFHQIVRSPFQLPVWKYLGFFSRMRFSNIPEIFSVLLMSLLFSAENHFVPLNSLPLSELY